MISNRISYIPSCSIMMLIYHAMLPSLPANKGMPNHAAVSEPSNFASRMSLRKSSPQIWSLVPASKQTALWLRKGGNSSVNNIGYYKASLTTLQTDAMPQIRYRKALDAYACIEWSLCIRLSLFYFACIQHSNTALFDWDKYGEQSCACSLRNQRYRHCYLKTCRTIRSSATHSDRHNALSPGASLPLHTLDTSHMGNSTNIGL